MFLNYIKIALRNLIKHKLYALINILGLAIGIASFILIEGNPDPMPIIYRFFSLWGFAQLIFCFICWIVIFRYRALIPLMYLFWLVEWGYRAIGYSLTREEIAIQGIYTNSITPGIVLAPYVLLLLIILFALSLKSKN